MLHYSNAADDNQCGLNSELFFYSIGQMCVMLKTLLFTLWKLPLFWNYILQYLLYLVTDSCLFFLLCDGTSGLFHVTQHNIRGVLTVVFVNALQYTTVHVWSGILLHASIFKGFHTVIANELHW